MTRPDWMTDPRVLAVVPDPEAWTDWWTADMQSSGGAFWEVGDAEVEAHRAEVTVRLAFDDDDPATAIATIAGMLRAPELEPPSSQPRSTACCGREEAPMSRRHAEEDCDGSRSA